MDFTIARVYIETSIVSYLRARPSRDVVLAAHQALTRRWWRGRRNYSLFVSQVVADEAIRGDRLASARRLRALQWHSPSCPQRSGDGARAELVRRRALPRKATIDAFHIGIAAAHQVDYLLTWNCKHLANATMRSTIETTCRSSGFTPPIICTPEELPSGVLHETS